MTTAIATRASWRDVAIPESIAALPRSEGGLPVPYVATWEGEDEMRIAPCPYAEGRLAVFPIEGQLGRTRPGVRRYGAQPPA